MLPKQQRIQTSDFPQKKPLFRGAFSWGTVSVFTNKEFKVAVVVSKKVFKTAVLRNKARRLVYMAIKKTNKTPNMSMLVYPNKDFFTTPFAVVQADLERFLKKHI